MNNQSNNYNRRRPAQFRPRRPFVRQVQTRILRQETPSANAQSASTTNKIPDPFSAQHTHRIVMGRGASKVFAKRFEDKTGGEGLRPRKHVAGARMSIMRKAPRMARRPAPRHLVSKREDDIIPPLADGAIRIIPLGGVEEVGRNMTAIEHKGDIIIVDMGFQFKEEGTPGIDYILPNTKYLEERTNMIRGVFITHGHLDHIGGIPYIMPRIGNPPIYSRQFGAIMIQKRQAEFPNVPPLDMKVLDKNETVAISPNMKVETFAISHTIPDSMGLIIHTSVGDIAFIEDVRVDNINGAVTEEEEKQYERFKGKKMLLLTMDSTSIEKHGFSLSESTVTENIEKIIKVSSGRIIIGTFASQVERIVNIVKIAEKYNKKIAVEGRSMKTNIEIIQQLKLAKISNIIPVEDIENYPPDRIIMLVTGAQGEEFAALMRIANKSHKYIRLRPTDTIVLSSSIIPTNYMSVVKLKDNLYRSEAKVITYLDSDIHASGHGNRGELKWIHEHIDYKFFMPVHGNHYMLRQHAELAQSLGKPRENIVVPDNGSLIEIDPEGNKVTVRKEKAPSGLVMVDGFSVGNVQDVVIRDRQALAQDGIFIVFGIINASTGKLKKSPDIISRGFVYLRESQELLYEVRQIIKETVERAARGMNPINIDFIKDSVSDAVSKYLLQKTAKRPMVIPVILTI
ncbi:ribonuclease J [Patescibacteria group bacterium]|nr:ribonuclease J [Patescibacteria group bacterium]MDE1946477.1 ribonuclease J [Patescibacteria group bacterium]MDE2011171.1 ribonuclease J [Patescibacteria group bacterium]MDE2233553.1 ribonuclease J [Patescibacteria group bacterium]